MSNLEHRLLAALKEAWEYRGVASDRPAIVDQRVEEVIKEAERKLGKGCVPLDRNCPICRSLSKSDVVKAMNDKAIDHKLSPGVSVHDLRDDSFLFRHTWGGQNDS